MLSAVTKINCAVEWRDTFSIVEVTGNFNVATALVLMHDELWMLVLFLHHGLFLMPVH